MYRLAISPCPNDTFAFFALLHQRTSWQAPLDLVLADIEELNRQCLAGRVDFCKISFHTYVLVRDRYQLLRAGSALGFGCGPLLVAKRPFDPKALSGVRIAIPGQYTTATLLLKLWLEKAVPLVEMPFDRIMPAVTSGEVDAGLIIHESRFTYPRYGLLSLVDLGEWWEQTTGHPIPLGGIVARRGLPAEIIKAFEIALAESITYAWNHESEAMPFMRDHAQEMEPDVMKAHVDLYVNRFTRDLGEKGRAAVDYLVSCAEDMGVV